MADVKRVDLGQMWKHPKHGLCLVHRRGAETLGGGHWWDMRRVIDVEVAPHMHDEKTAEVGWTFVSEHRGFGSEQEGVMGDDDKMVMRDAGPALARAVRSRVANTGLLGAVEALFLRVLMQSPGPRPSLAIIAGKGVTCTAVIFLGKIPSKFEAHAEATAPVKNAAMVRHGEQAYAEATGAGPDGALLALYEHLRTALKSRIESDLAVWESASGCPWEGSSER